MDVNTYCDILNTQLVSWKAKAYDMMRKLDQLSHDKKQDVTVPVSEVADLIDEVGEKVSSLQRECPSDWSPQKEEIDNKIAQLNEAWDQAWAEMSVMSPDDYS